MRSRRLALVLAAAASLMVVTPARGAVLYDQYNNATPASSGDSQASMKNDTYDFQVADDFVVAPGQSWRVDRIDVLGGSNNSAGDHFNIRFFGNAGTLPRETPFYTALSRPALPGSSFVNAAVGLNPSVSLPPGHYWVSVQADLTGGPSFWNWRYRTVQSGFGAAFRTPSGCATWQRRTAGCAGGPAANPDQVFRLLGRLAPKSGGSITPRMDTTAPVFTGKPSAKPKSFRAGKGTTFTYSLSEKATVTFTIQRRLKGRRVTRKGKRRCVKPARRNRHKRRCSRYKRKGGRLHQNGAAGKNTKSFSGRKLKPGRYRAQLVAVDAAGNRSKVKNVSFKVVRARRNRR